MELLSFLNSSYKASTSFTVTVKQSKVLNSEIWCVHCADYDQPYIPYKHQPVPNI